MSNYQEIKIFIIEDDFVFVKILTNMLELINDEIKNRNLKLVYHTFYSVKEANYELSKYPDIVLLDYFIMDDELNTVVGSNILNNIKSQQSQVDVIVVSAQESEQVKKELLDNGATAYISKDETSLTTLKPTLMDIINKRFA